MLLFFDSEKIAESHPEIVAELSQKINEATKTLFLPNRGTHDPAACAAAISRYNGYDVTSAHVRYRKDRELA